MLFIYKRDRLHLDIIVDFFFHSFPEDSSVASRRHVCEDRVSEDGFHGVGIRGRTRARRDPEESVLRIDGAQFTLIVESHPSDVVSHALELVTRDRGLHHS